LTTERNRAATGSPRPGMCEVLVKEGKRRELEGNYLRHAVPGVVWVVKVGGKEQTAKRTDSKDADLCCR